MNDLKRWHYSQCKGKLLHYNATADLISSDEVMMESVAI